MYLRQLTLHNFKGFDNSVLQFHPRMTVLAGVNGSGKTSVLEGIAIAVSTLFTRMDELKARGLDKGQAHLKAYGDGSTQDIQPQYPVEISAVMDIGGKTLSWKRALKSSVGKTNVIEATDIIDYGRQLLSRVRGGDIGLTLPVIAYYGTGRLWDYHREKQHDTFTPNNRLKGYLDCVDGTANIKLMLNWFTMMTVEKYQKQELGIDRIPELEAVYAAMEACYKRLTGNPEVKIQYKISTRQLEVAYKEPTGDWMCIPISQLSDGYKCTISLVADIAYRMAVLNPHLLGNVCTETDGIVLIDEVDLHLHPAWQQRILGDLMAIFPKVQFIVTTHAPAVISTVKSENMLLLDNGEAYEPSGEVHGKDTNTIISSVMGASQRPVEIQNKFAAFYRFIDNKEADQAEKELTELENLIGNDDPELAGCRIKLKFLKAPSEQKVAH